MPESEEPDENVSHLFNPIDPWDVCPAYPVADWQREVAENNTRLGYREWVNHQLEINQDEEDE